MASYTPASTAPSTPYLASSASLPSRVPDDQRALLFPSSAPASPEPYTPSLGNLPGARKLAAAAAPRLRRLPFALPPRLALPLVLALGLCAALALLATSARDSLAAYLTFTPEEARRIASAFFDPPAWPLDPAGIAVLDAAEGEHTVTAIVVHGLGDRGDGRPYTWTLPKRFPYVRWVAPTADYLNVTVRNGAETRAWFDIASFEDIWGDEDVVGYMHSQQQLNRLIDAERQKMLDAGKLPRIVMLGFSQGGVMSLLATLTARTRDRIEAAVVMSTYLPLLDSFDALFSPKARDTPLLWVHGRADKYLTFANAELSLARLVSAPIGMTDVAFRGYDAVQHGWSNGMLDDVAGWFAEKVPQVRGAEVLLREEELEEEEEVESAVEQLEAVEAQGARVPARSAHRLVRRQRTGADVYAGAARA
ncbi:hypothetical protein JCM10450v2_004130 [Rhodotorula kratochvilovae]